MGEATLRSRFTRAFSTFTCSAAILLSTGCFMQPMSDRNGTDSDRELPVNNATDNETEFVDEPVIEEPIRAPEDDVVEDELLGEPIDDPNLVPLDEFGDLNDDGLIDDTDVEAFRTAFGNFTDDALTEAADFDDDGMVTLLDFQIYLTMVPRE